MGNASAKITRDDRVLALDPYHGAGLGHITLSSYDLGDAHVGSAEVGLLYYSSNQLIGVYGG